MQIKLLFIASLLLTALTSIADTAATPTARDTTPIGIVLYNQYKPALNELRIEAESGHPEAQYYLAETLRKINHYITPEAVKWYEASAQKGDIYSMIRLGSRDTDLCNSMHNCPLAEKPPSEWLKQAKETALSESDRGNAEAMYLVYRLTGDRDWLIKSANSGFAQASYMMGIGDRQGEGFFLLPSKRANSVEKWMEKSAEGGYPKGIMAYAGILADRGDIAGFNKWKEEAALRGYVSAVFDLACDLGHEPDKYGVSLDLVKSYGLLSLLSELDGGGNIKENVQEVFPIIKNKMTPAQIAEGKIFAKQWINSHSPLSFYPDKLDD